MNSTTPSPSIPPSAPTASGENLLIPFMIFYVFLCLLNLLIPFMILYLYLLCRSHGAKRPEIYKTSTTCFSSLMRGLGRHMWGEISSSSWGKETFIYLFSLIFPPQVCDGVLHCPDGEDESQCERGPEDSKEEHHVEKNDVLVALNSVSVLY